MQGPTSVLPILGSINYRFYGYAYLSTIQFFDLSRNVSVLIVVITGDGMLIIHKVYAIIVF